MLASVFLCSHVTTLPMEFPESRLLRITTMPCNAYVSSNEEVGSNANPLGRAVVRTSMASQLANISGALQRATEAITEATLRLEYCHMQVSSARIVINEPLPEEEEIQSVIVAIHRIEQNIRSRCDTVTQQLKCLQMNFMIDAEQERVNQGTNSDTNSDTVRPIRDLSSLPRYIDHDGDTVRGTSSDGMSYAGTVVRGGVGPSSTSGSYQATSEQLPYQ